jgi:hypothetical protein
MGAKMRGVLRAGVLYFTIIFVIGFALGTIRVLLLVPRLGAVTSELIELPIILTAAWILCDRLITHFQVPRHWWARLSMGAIAFTLLMIAEAVLSVATLRQLDYRSLGQLSLPIRRLGVTGAGHFCDLPVGSKAPI